MRVGGPAKRRRVGSNDEEGLSVASTPEKAPQALLDRRLPPSSSKPKGRVLLDWDESHEARVRRKETPSRSPVRQVKKEGRSSRQKLSARSMSRSRSSPRRISVSPDRMPACRDGNRGQKRSRHAEHHRSRVPLEKCKLCKGVITPAQRCYRDNTNLHWDWGLAVRASQRST